MYLKSNPHHGPQKLAQISGDQKSEIMVSNFTSLMAIISFTLLTGLGGVISIPLPFTPIPITLQTFAVFLSGMILGKKNGTLAQLLYIGAGILGIPWFSGMKSGMVVLYGPSGGYLIGFLVSAWITGWMKEKIPYFGDFRNLIGIGIIANMCIYIFGLIGLLLQEISITKALSVGFFPYLPGDFFKLGLIIILYKFSSIFLVNSHPEFNNLSELKKKPKQTISFIVVVGILAGYVFYLYSNGIDIPPFLHIISICLSSIIVIWLMTIYFRPNKQ